MVKIISDICNTSLSKLKKKHDKVVKNWQDNKELVTDCDSLVIWEKNC